MNVAKNQTRNVCTGNIGDSEITLRDKRKREAECQSGNRDSPGVRILLVYFLENLVCTESDNHCKHKENCGITKDQKRLRGRIVESYYNRKYNHTDDIVDNCGIQNRRSDFTLQNAHFTKRLHGNGNACCRHNGSHEKSLEKSGSTESVESVKCHIQERTAGQRNEHARTCNRKCLRTGFDQFL